MQIRPYKHSRKTKSEIKDVDFNKLIKSLDLTSFAEYRDYVILQLLMDTGMRIGETLNLKMNDVLIDKKELSAFFTTWEYEKIKNSYHVNGNY